MMPAMCGVSLSGPSPAVSLMTGLCPFMKWTPPTPRCVALLPPRTASNYSLKFLLFEIRKALLPSAAPSRVFGFVFGVALQGARRHSPLKMPNTEVTSGSCRRPADAAPRNRQDNGCVHEGIPRLPAVSECLPFLHEVFRLRERHSLHSGREQRPLLHVALLQVSLRGSPQDHVSQTEARQLVCSLPFTDWQVFE